MGESAIPPVTPGLPRLDPDARAVVDGPCGLEEWAGARWNVYAATCERNMTMCIYRFVHIDNPEVPDAS
jgi:hypothetical protein